MSRKNFLGTGWSFPVRIGPAGGIATSSFEDNIHEAIKVVLGTALGERVMNPQFGSRIHDFVFHPNTANTASIVGYYAEQALQKHEPRIRDIGVRAMPDPNNENMLLLEVSYKLVHDNTLRNMVYPFYLRREQDL
ncbi:MAG: GPW/gp25 family protein [Myxococcales bacterium]|nr:GPW/gp25 family protein [Myxococcales bacterium]